MSDNDGMDQPILKLTPAEKAAYLHLFNLADSDSIGVVTGERAVTFFEKTHVPAPVLGEIWQLADTENRGFLSKPGFCMVLRMIGWYQSGQTQPNAELAFKPAPLPRFDGITLPTPPQQIAQSPTGGAFPPGALQPQLSGQSTGGGPIRVPPLDPAKVQQYSGLFERSGAQNGILDGGTAKSIFERAGLPNEVLGKIWMLSDREQRGGLDQTEFIVAMHLLTSMKTRAMIILPGVIPQGLWDAAARRGQRPPSRNMSGAGVVPRQFTGGQSTQPRTQSPLARPPGYSTPPLQNAQLTGTPWLITQQEKGQYDQFFSQVDTTNKGVISGEQAVNFFSNSGLPEDTLAHIWDLADINSDGQLNRDEFAVAMYLIKQQRVPNAPPLMAFLPPALIPPSMRSGQQPQQQTPQQAAPPPPKPSAADDLFGLDSSPSQGSQQPSVLTPTQQPSVLQPQSTGASVTRDPFGSSVPASPSSPARFQQAQGTGGIFKPFVPTSAFGSSLTSQHTGASSTSSQPQQQPSFAQQQQRGLSAPTASTMDDLLGDSEAHTAESGRLTNESTELANMSSQIGNLRNQMEATQNKKSVTQADLNSTSAQKRDLEQRLQQFRAQYETEVRTVKELEQQLVTSRDSTKKLNQELAMLEGTYQDLTKQHQSIAQQLQADQQENASLKQRISQLNTEIASLKPQIEKMKLDARQQKGLVSINKKQLATNESERDRLQGEKSDLDREAAEQTRSLAASPEPPAVTSQASNVVSPAASTMSSTNPFFKKASGDGTTSPPAGPTPSAFDTLFGPSSSFAPSGQAGSRTGTPPATSFIGRTMPAVAAAGAGAVVGAGAFGLAESASSVGEGIPAGTPSAGSGQEISRDIPFGGAIDNDDPPPPPESRQFTPTNLPLRGGVLGGDDGDAASSVKVMPPASRAGDEDIAPDTQSSLSPNADVETERETIPGAFPSEELQPGTTAEEAEDSSEQNPAATAATSSVNDDFDKAFAGFGEGKDTAEAAPSTDPFASSQPRAGGFSDEFPPIQSLERDYDSDTSDDGTEEVEKGVQPQSSTFEDNPGTAAELTGNDAIRSLAPATIATNEVPTPSEELPDITKQASPPTYEESDDPAHGGSGERTDSNQFPPEFGGLLPAREDPTSPPPPATSPPVETQTTAVETIPAEEPSFMPPQRTSSLQPGSASTTGVQGVHTPSTDVFVDAFSRPMSSATDAGATKKNAFDDFDDFNDLSEAKEVDKPDETLDFGFGRQSADEFNPAFDSPAQTTPVPAARTIQDLGSNGFANFAPNVSTSSGIGGAGGEGSGSGTGSIQQTPQGAQHDWDAIFSGLDSSKDVDTSLSSTAPTTTDPWATTNGNAAVASSSAAPMSSSTLSPTSTSNTVYAPPPGPPPGKRPLGADRGGAITPGTEHDDPILKRLTGMGYPRSQALDALERYDYDLNRAVDHLTSA